MKKTEKENMEKNKSVLSKSILQTAGGLLLFVLLLSLFWLFIYLIEKYLGITLLINKDDLNLVLAIIATIGTAMYIYNSNKFEKEKEDIKRQVDLLIILSEELDFLSGNLKAYKESFSKPNHYPLYELWRVDTSLYFAKLSRKINSKETLELKKNLMKIKDKIILISNFKSEMRTLEEDRGEEDLIKKIEPGKIIRKQIITIIDKEILPLIENSKKIITILVD